MGFQSVGVGRGVSEAVHIITDKDEIKRLTRRGQRRTVIAELRRRGLRYEVAHDGWPVIYISEVSDLPSKRPNFAALGEV